MIALAAAWAAPYHADHHHADVVWRTIETRFFRVHYAASDDPDDAHAFDTSRTAAEVARVADELLLALGDHTGWIPRGPIHVLVSDHADGMTAFGVPPWRWIVLSADPGTEVMRLRGRLDWVEDALAHELGHVVGHRLADPFAPTAASGIDLEGTVARGSWGGGFVLPAGPHVPYGWSEGAAEAWSEAIGVNRSTSERRAMLRTSALEGRLLDWDEWLVAGDKGDAFDAERAYQHGWDFARWLAARDGHDVFVEMARLRSRRWPSAWARALARATGEPARASYAAWRADLERRAEAEAAAIRAAGLVEGEAAERTLGAWRSADPADTDPWSRRSPRDREESRELEGSWELHPRTSADGRWYAEARVGWVRVVPFDEDELPGIAGQERPYDPDRADTVGRMTLWIPAAFGSAFAFVPGRDAIVVAAPEGSDRTLPLAPLPPDRWHQLYVVDLASVIRNGAATLDPAWGRRMTAIPGTLRARDPAVSPDGRLVTWLASTDGTTNLWVAHLDGSGARALSAFDDGTWLSHPSFSPDGRRIVVSSFRDGRGDLCAVELGSGAWSRLTDTPEDELDPTWAADGIWYTTDPDGVRDVYRLGPDGRVDRMTRVLGGASTPWVTARGNLMYTATTAYGFQAMAVARDELLFLPAGAAAEGPAPAPGPRPPAPETRRYHPLHGALPPTIAPIVRLDVADGAVVPLAGAWVHARDAVERADLQVLGLAGEDLYGHARFTWRGFPPELSVWGSGERDRLVLSPSTLAHRTVGAAGAVVSGRWREDVTGSGEALLVGLDDDGTPALASHRLAANLSAGEVPELGGTGAHGTVGLTRAWSTVPLGTDDDGETLRTYAWWRVELDLDGVSGLPVRTGPLREHGHRLEWRVHLRALDRNVAAVEEPKAGGDLPLALRLGVVEPSAPFPGYAPFAVTGERLGVVGARWVVPVAPRLRAGAGAFHVSGVEAALGADAGNAWSYRGGVPERPGIDAPRDHGRPVLADGVAELRVRALALDERWDSFARVAWGFDGPRVTLGLGTGFE